MIALLLGLLALNAQATSILADTDYHLKNHPDCGAAEPYYGLRLDGLLTDLVLPVLTAARVSAWFPTAPAIEVMLNRRSCLRPVCYTALIIMNK